MKTATRMKGMGSYGTVGIEMVLSILFGLFIGTKLDDWLGTKPIMALVWFGFGCAAAGRAVYRAWKSMQVEAKREEAEEGNPAPAFPDEKALAWEREDRKRAREEQEAREAAAREAREGGLEKGQDGATSSGDGTDVEKRDE
jgi:F0F1-type ATP synthase assembly protein I